MPRHEPARRQSSGEPPGPKVKMQIGKDGQFRPVLDEPADEPAVETEEPAEQEDERG